MSSEEHKRRERAQAIGLFRYQLICPALDEGLSTKQRGKLVREIAAATHTDPFGNQVRISRDTPDRWIRRYRAGRVRGVGAHTAAAGRAHRRPGAGAGRVAQAGKPDPHGGAGGPDPAHRDRLGAFGVHRAAPFPPAGVDGPGQRAESWLSWLVDSGQPDAGIAAASPITQFARYLAVERGLAACVIGRS